METHLRLLVWFYHAGHCGGAFRLAKVCLEQQDAYYTTAFNGSSTTRDEVGALLSSCFTIPDDADVDAENNAKFDAALKKCEESL